MGPSQLYRPSLALLTDLYQLTMAQGYWSSGVAERESTFHLFFRKPPFGGAFAVSAGQEAAVDWVQHLSFDEADRAYLATLEDAFGDPLFHPEFLDYLGRLRFTGTLEAMPEGTVAFPHEPIIRVTAPVLQAQLVETALLTQVNFATLVATKSARIQRAARGQQVLEFGLRRAQGIDGGLTASRAAYLGGCTGTSNVLAGRLFGIPVRGTHAHSWVALFDDEPTAFRTYAEAMPGNVVLLVDTYDTLEGVRHAIDVGRWLKSQGKRLLGVRLDSGDLEWLSKRARLLLDDAGLTDTVVMASNDLDEYRIDRLLSDGAAIVAWGVGTRLATCSDQPSLGGVYKLAAVREGDVWQPRIKLSETRAKVSIPGRLRVRRYLDAHRRMVADAIYDETLGISEPGVLVDPGDDTRRRAIPADTPFEEPLVAVLSGGERVREADPLEVSRARVVEQLSRLDPTVTRLTEPHPYPAGLELRLHEQRTRLVLEAKERT